MEAKDWEWRSWILKVSDESAKLQNAKDSLH